uniref:Uncharacterized protein n=1 Tax=Rhizophora mucronata TaxID=61149 RepID=A0A2P2NSP2_RHIMU
MGLTVLCYFCAAFFLLLLLVSLSILDEVHACG